MGERSLSFSPPSRVIQGVGGRANDEGEQALRSIERVSNSCCALGVGFQEALEGVAGRPLEGQQHVGVMLIPDPLKRQHHPVFGHYLLTLFAQSIVRGRHKIPRPRYPSTAAASSQSLAESDILITSQPPETLWPHWVLPSALYHQQPNSVHTPHHPLSKVESSQLWPLFGLVRRA